MLDTATGPVFISLRGLHPALFENGVSDDAVAHHTQIGRGSMDGELGIIPLNAGTVHTCHHTVTIRTQGQFGNSFVSVFIGLDVPSPTRILGQPAGRDTILVCNPRSVVDNLDGAGLSWASLSFPTVEFERAYHSLTHDQWSVHAPPMVIRHPNPHAVASLRVTLTSLVAIARHQPALLLDPRWRANAEAGLQSAFLAAVIGTPAHHPTIVATTHRSRDIIDAVDAHLNTPGLGIVAVSELCDVAGTPRRTLERVFHDTFAMGPAEYARRRALNAVRRALLDENDDAQSVTEVAIAHGFWHLGRFSQQYRSLFGELPSQTIRHRRRAKSNDVARFVATLSRFDSKNKKGRVATQHVAYGLS